MFYLKLYYKLLDWEWYTNSNVMRLFIHCLLKANRQTKKWQGYTIERGSFITSYPNLAKELHLSTQQIRTALSKLKLTGEITHKSQGLNSFITVNNYNEYQPNNTLDNRQITGEQQTANRPITPTIECNNDINDKNDKSVINASNPNNIFNKSVKEFHNQMKKVLNYAIRLSNAQCDKIVDLSLRIPDFEQTIPIVLERIKNLQWRYDDGNVVNADVNWLLEKENYISVYCGKFSNKEELVRNWKPKGWNNER